MSGPCSRRAFLRSSGLAAVSVLGGCATFERGVELGDVLVRNSYANPHTLYVELERDGERIREETFDLAGDDHEVIEPTWPSDPATYTFRYVAAGPNVELDIHERTVTADDVPSGEYDCVVAAVTLLPSEPPYVQVGRREDMGGNCSPD